MRAGITEPTRSPEIGDLGDAAEEHRESGGRDEHGETADGDDRPDGDGRLVAAPVHLREERAPEHRGVGDGGAGERREDGAARDCDQREAPRHAGDETVHRIDRLPGDPGVKHELAHQDEQGNGEEGEALGRVHGVAHELLDPDRAAHERVGADEIHREEREHHRQSQHHQGHEATDEDGEDLVPLHWPLPRRPCYRGR